jgi:hypothetical protein
MSDQYAATILATPNLLRYFRFGESSGTVATDAAGGDDGVYQGSPTLGAAGAIAGDADTAVLLSGSQYIDGIDLGGLVPPLTVETWLYMTGNPAGGFPMVLTDTTTNDRLDCRFDASTRKPQFSTAWTSFFSSSFAIDFNRFYHIAWVVGTPGVSDSRIHINGLPVASATTSANAATVGSINIGRRATSPGTFNFQGRIDELAIYDRELTEAELADHYAIGHADITGGGIGWPLLRRVAALGNVNLVRA